MDAYFCDSRMGKIFKNIAQKKHLHRLTCAGVCTAAGIHAELEALGMYVIRYILHAMREFLRVRNEAALLIALL